MSVRWRKILRDVVSERGRLALLAAAIAASLVAVGAVLGAFDILSREMARSYGETEPASATLVFEDEDVDDALVARARAWRGVKDAVARDVVTARVAIDGGQRSRPLLLFVVEDFSDLRLARFWPVSGAWPPTAGTMVVERTALDLLQAQVGKPLSVTTVEGRPQSIIVSGIVHDPALAPAEQERQGYGYIDRETYGRLGTGALHELRVSFVDEGSAAAVANAAAVLADELARDGHHVHQIRVPPPRQHPHQRQMKTILTMMLSFAGLSLLLSAVLMATSLSSLLARQVREIGVMKTVGANAGQVAALYVALVGGLGVVAVAASLPPALLLAQGLAARVANLLNFAINDPAVAGRVIALQVLVGVMVPVAIASWPIAGAARTSVRAALDQFGVEVVGFAALLSRLPFSLRNALRRPRRTLLVVTLLSSGAAIFLAAINLSLAWRANIAKVDEQRDYDVEVRLPQALPATTAEQLRALPGVESVEVWGFGEAAFARPGQIDLVRTWPDGGHGSFVVMAPPVSSVLVHFPPLAGRWLQADDDQPRSACGEGIPNVVLNQGAFAQAGSPALRSTVLLSIEGAPSRWCVVGVVEEVGAAGVAYVGPGALAAATAVDPGRLLRIVARGSADEALRGVDKLLLDAGVAVVLASPLNELEMAVDGHIDILIQMLLALAMLMGAVGAMGMASTVSVSVLERTREFGVLLAIGATPQRLQRMIIAEAIVVGVISWFVGVVMSLPLTAALAALIGSLGFMASLPFLVAWPAVAGWIVVAVVVAAVAAALPARALSRLSVREALSHS